MASTTFEKPMGTEVEAIKSSITSVSNRVSNIENIPTNTDVSTLEGIKTHILTLLGSMSAGNIVNDYIALSSGYTDGVFTANSRYTGQMTKVNSAQASGYYTSRNGDMVLIGINKLSETPVWKIDSVSLSSNLTQ